MKMNLATIVAAAALAVAPVSFALATTASHTAGTHSTSGHHHAAKTKTAPKTTKAPAKVEAPVSSVPTTPAKTGQ